MNVLGFVLGIFKGVGAFVMKALPFLIAYRQGKKDQTLEELKKEVEDIADAQEIELDVTRASRTDLVKWLRDNRPPKSK